MESKQFLEYVWLGGSGWDFRSKCKVVSQPVTTVEECPEWNYDGSSTGQATTKESEVLLRPAKLVADPFRGGHHKVVFCETYHPDGKPTVSNFRYFAKKVFEEEACQKEDIWYGVEQEYILSKEVADALAHNLIPIAWVEGKAQRKQGVFYCGVGAGRAISRNIPEEHLKVCLEAGLQIAGINAETFPGQWEYQVGIVKGLDACDQVWLSRYFLYRVCEKHNTVPVFDPKPIKGDWNGSGCHVNVSTNSTRAAKGGEAVMDVIKAYIEKMEKVHHKDLLFYGEKNNERLTGAHETANMNFFNYSVGGRDTSIRVPYTTSRGETSYFEDRRPAGNMDPYLCMARIADAMFNQAKHLEEFEDALNRFKLNLKDVHF